MQKNRVIFYLIVISLFYTACGSQDTQNEETSTKADRNIPSENIMKAGVGIVALHPEYQKEDTAFFELYLDEALTNEAEKYYPTQPDNYKRAKPKYFDSDKKIAYLVCLGWRPGNYKVVVNDETGEEMYLPEDSARYVHLEWGEFITESISIRRLNPDENPIREYSGDKGDVLEWDVEKQDFKVITTYEQFAKVQNPSDSTQSGWIRWVKNNKLWIDINPISINEKLLEKYERIKGRLEIKPEASEIVDSTDTQS